MKIMKGKEVKTGKPLENTVNQQIKL